MKRIMPKKEPTAVLWRCDKKDCLKINYRTLSKGHIIETDTCDSCGRHIREPLSKEVGPKKTKDK